MLYAALLAVGFMICLVLLKWVRRFKGGADRINEYFADACVVFVHNGDPAARLAALTAAKVAASEQRASMVRYLRSIAGFMTQSDPRRATQLQSLGDEIESRDWTLTDSLNAKRLQHSASPVYAVALDATDSTVFRRQYPHLFSEVAPETQDDRADRIDDYFRDAARIYMHHGDPAARLAALTAGKVADTEQRSSMARYLRLIADLGRSADAVVSGKLELLADEIEERDWSAQEIRQAKRALGDASPVYARALDALDAQVFRRQHPHVFSQDRRW